MSCCNCCDNTLNLGCFNSCNLILNTGIVVDLINAGTWVFELNFGNTVQYFSTDVADGETVIFTLNNLNENYTYIGGIISPNGELVKIEKNGIEYDCFEFSTKIGKFGNSINV